MCNMASHPCNMAGHLCVMFGHLCNMVICAGGQRPSRRPTYTSVQYGHMYNKAACANMAACTIWPTTCAIRYPCDMAGRLCVMPGHSVQYGHSCRRAAAQSSIDLRSLAALKRRADGLQVTQPHSVGQKPEHANGQRIGPVPDPKTRLTKTFPMLPSDPR